MSRSSATPDDAICELAELGEQQPGSVSEEALPTLCDGRERVQEDERYWLEHHVHSNPRAY